MKRKIGLFILGLLLVLIFTSSHSFAKNQILTIDHFVPHTSIVPAIAGEEVELYVREKVLAGIAKNFASIKANGKVVLMIHGATVPAVVAYDFPYEGYSWMEFLAQAGFDTFALELTGYGLSPRPWPMDNPCNLGSGDLEYLESYGFPEEPCVQDYPWAITSSESEWDDIDAAVEYIKQMRGVEKVSLIGWSQGGPRAGGYAAKNPDKVDKLILLAPLGSSEKPQGDPPYEGTAFRITSYDSPWGLDNRWRLYDDCPGQREPEVYDMFMDAWLETDPVGATWGPGVGRSASGRSWWQASEVKAPTLIAVGLKDGLRFASQGVFNEISNDNKVFMTIDCTTHYTFAEWAHKILFKASKDWLLHQSINGIKYGTVNVDVDGSFTKNPEDIFE
jgi:pimeloyl-ACP methyl ester carboxylesterase